MPSPSRESGALPGQGTSHGRLHANLEKHLSTLSMMRFSVIFGLREIQLLITQYILYFSEFCLYVTKTIFYNENLQDPFRVQKPGSHATGRRCSMWKASLYH